MTKIMGIWIIAAGVAGVLSSGAFAAQGQMIAKDYWLKKHAPGVAAELCEGKILICMGMKQEPCAEMFMPAAKSCGEKMYASMPDYLSGKEMTKKYKSQMRECAWPITREQVVRQIRGNPKPPRRQMCMEFIVPNAPTPKLEEWNSGGTKKPKAVK